MGGTCGAAALEYVDVVPIPVPCTKIEKEFNSSTIDWAPRKFMVPICTLHCDCNYCGSSTRDCNYDPSTAGTDVPDNPLAARWCSLCGPKFNAPIDVHCFELNHFE